MILFHTSPYIIEQPDVNHSREHLDFGKGFYLTTIREQAEKYALRFIRREKTAYINIYWLDDDLSAFRIKEFLQYDAEWLEYVGQCRTGHAHQEFDLIAGGIADDRVFNTVDLYFAGEISKEDALKRLIYEKPNHQICILNQEIISQHLTFKEAVPFIEKGADNGSK